MYYLELTNDEALSIMAAASLYVGAVKQPSPVKCMNMKTGESEITLDVNKIRGHLLNVKNKIEVLFND